VLGGLDRSLGVLFGIARGVLLIIVAYIGGGMVIAPEHWPGPVRAARSVQYAYEGAAWLAGQLPQAYRPQVPLPPVGVQTRAADLLQLPALGRLGRP
jgi:membrane protein required for colicin V production